MTENEMQSSPLCPTPTKLRFATMKSALDAAPRAGFAVGHTLVPYDNCACGWIHLTKERDGEKLAFYSSDELLAMDSKEFNVLVRMDVTGRVHPDVFGSIKVNSLLARWEEALKLFFIDMETQLVSKAGDRSPSTQDWRKRIRRVQTMVREKRAAIQHLRRQVAAEHSRSEKAHSMEVGGTSFSPAELRHIAGERALTRLKHAHWVEFLTILREEHAAVGVEPGANLMKSFQREGLLNDNPSNTEENV